tara:strand:- start:14066 stop:14938 length:873 start_codon:yes stop_codon:yes gene_type:complete
MQIKVSSVEGNTQKLDGGAMFGNAPRAVWEKWIPADDRGRIPLSCRCLLVQMDNKNILVEAGIGAFFEPKLADRFGVQNSDRHMLLENLAAKGLEPEDIDYVLLSHLHFDHAGGLLPSYKEMQAGNQELVFPKAKFLVGEKAWERAIDPHPRDRASFIPLLNQKLEESGRLEILKQQEWQTYDNFHFFLSNGHTPGQYISILQGQNKKIAFCGDLIPGKAWMHIPITMGYDRFPELLIDEKKEFYQLMQAENDLLFFTHDPEFAAATFMQDEKGKIQAKDCFAQLDAVSI